MTDAAARCLTLPGDDPAQRGAYAHLTCDAHGDLTVAPWVRTVGVRRAAFVPPDPHPSRLHRR